MNPEEQPQQIPESAPAPSRRFSKKIIAAGMIILIVLVGAITQMLIAKSGPEERVIADTPNGRVVAPVITDSQAATGTPPSIVKDAQGREYLTGEIIVAFRVNVTIDDAKAIIAAQGGTIKQHFTNLPVFLIGISESGAEGVDAAVKKFARLDQVEKAEPNYLTSGTGKTP